MHINLLQQYEKKIVKHGYEIPWTYEIMETSMNITRLQREGHL